MMLELKTIELRNVSHNYGCNSNAISNLNFSVKSGEFVCVLGPSGCGKSTFLKILAGHLQPDSGEIFINDQSLYKNVKNIRSHIAYASEEESFDPLLSVQENIYFASAIRHQDLTREEHKKKTDDLLDELSLHEKRNVVPGDHFQKTLSGGERKRLNVGLELTGDASMLLIDEPTTGLSSYDSENIINTIKKRSHSAICFVSIHQPSSKLFKSFDKALLLDANGNLAFFGTPDEMESVFKKNLQTSIQQKSKVEPSKLDQIQKLGTPEFILEIIQLNLHKKNELEFQKSNEIENHLDQKTITGESIEKINPKKRSHKQFTTHFQRAILSKVRNKSGFLSGIAIAPILAFLVAGVLRFSESEKYTFSDAPHIPAYIFISLVIAMFFGLTNSVGDVMRDKQLLSRERGHGIIISYYILSKLIVLSILSFIQSCIYIWIGNSILEIYLMHWHYFVWIMMTNLVGSAIGLLISVISKSQKTSLSLIPMIIIPQILLAGALIQYNEINPLLHLKKGKNQAITKNKVPEFCNLIPLRWSYEALLISQNEYNLLNKNLSKVEESKATLLGKKTLSEIEKTKLSQHKEAYTMLYGLRADTSSQIIRQMKKIISSLEANSFDAQDYLTEGKLSSMNFFQNNKVNDLITQAEIETEDYRNNKIKNATNSHIFLAKNKNFGGKSFHTHDFNFLVLVIFTFMIFFVTSVTLRNKLNSFSGEFI